MDEAEDAVYIGSSDEEGQDDASAALAAVERELRQASRRRCRRRRPAPRALAACLLPWPTRLHTTATVPHHKQVEAQLERLLARQSALQEERERLQRVAAAERKHPRRDWTGSFEWDARVQRLLGDVFGLQTFRPLQVWTC